MFRDSALAAGDFSGDGRLDVAIASAGYNAITVLRQVPATPPPPPPPPPPPECGPHVTIRPSGEGSPYTSYCVVAGAPGTITDVDVSLFSGSHTWPDDVDFLLVGPGGQNATFLSDAGGSFDIQGIYLTFNDEEPTPLPDSVQLETGDYRPENDEPGDPFDPRSPRPAAAARCPSSTARALTASGACT